VTELRVRRAWHRLPGWLRRLAEIGVLPSDSEELRVRKAVLVLSSALMASLAFVWVATYALLGLWVPAAIPFAYQVASVISIYVFARTRRYRLFRRSQLWMSLLLPFFLQWSLGGFENSSAVSLWGITSPLGALLFVGARESVPWFAAFVGLVALSVGINPALASGAPDIPGGVVLAFFALNILGVATTAYALLQYFVRERERALEESDRLLLNVLPEPVAARLKAEEGIIADSFESVTVLFADIVGFTSLSERLPASELVALLDSVFARWDALAARFGVEKIKTIGDAYMVAAGIPLPRDDHAQVLAEMALEMRHCAAETGVALASSAARSSSTTCGVTPSTPRAEWSPTPHPARFRSQSARTRRCGPTTSWSRAGRSRSRARERWPPTSCSGGATSTRSSRPPPANANRVLDMASGEARLPPRWFIRAFWHVHRRIVRASRGRRGLWPARPDKWGALRLTTRGRRSGEPRSVILGYYEDGPNLVSMAMNGWGPAEPAWWLNLQADPQAVVELAGGDRREVRGRRALGEERERLWQRWRELDKNLDSYAARRPQETAVVVFEPRVAAD
jgi:adenylate cyclase